MMNGGKISRRRAVQRVGLLCAAVVLRAHGDESSLTGAVPARANPDVRKTLSHLVAQTPFVDTHEHLIEEHERLAGSSGTGADCDDWTTVLNHYLDSDLRTAGMPRKDHDKFFNSNMDPSDKWTLLQPYWPAVKNTGYGQAVRIALRQLYGVDDLSSGTIATVQSKYEQVRRKGFYKQILKEVANIESCQVNCLSGNPFRESSMPTLLMQDIGVVGMFVGPDFERVGKPTGIEVKDLGDWHGVIDWWFDKYGKYAVAIKSQNAYSRDIDYEQIPAERAEEIFKKRLQGDPISEAERKTIEDHLFWYVVEKATQNDLPVKLHTGYYAGSNYMRLGRVIRNPGSATDLCRASPETRFVFMHIGYPYYEEMIAVAKHYTNAYIDMCWSWIINPLAAKDFLKKYLVTAPANKVLTFGGDYIPVEPVTGHAAMARRGIAAALSEVVEEGWIKLNDSSALVDPVMRGNARSLFALEKKQNILSNVQWG